MLCRMQVSIVIYAQTQHASDWKFADNNKSFFYVIYRYSFEFFSFSNVPKECKLSHYYNIRPIRLNLLRLLAKVDTDRKSTLTRSRSIHRAHAWPSVCASDVFRVSWGLMFWQAEMLHANCKET